MSKQSLILLLIGLAVGAVCAFSLAQSLGKRGAHGRASMVVLARHVDHLRSLHEDSACSSETTRARMQQIGFASKEIDFAFAPQVQRDSTFARRSKDMQAAAALPAQLAGCADLDTWLTDLARGCQACHRDYR